MGDFVFEKEFYLLKGILLISKKYFYQIQLMHLDYQKLFSLLL